MAPRFLPDKVIVMLAVLGELSSTPEVTRRKMHATVGFELGTKLLVILVGAGILTIEGRRAALL